MKISFKYHLIILTGLLLLFTHKNHCQSKLNSLKTEKNIHLFDNVAPSNGVFHINELDNDLFLLFDTVSSTNYNKWAGIVTKDVIGKLRNPTYKQLIGFKSLKPQRIWNSHALDTVSIYPISENFSIIPMQEGEENTVLCLWEKVTTDSLRFLNTITPNIWTKYATVHVIDHRIYNNTEYLFTKRIGGEGGGNFESIILFELDQFELIEIKEVSIGYSHDDGQWANLYLEFLNDGFVQIVESRDFMELKNNKWVKIKSTVHVLAEIKL